MTTRVHGDLPSVAQFSLWADSFHEGEWACRAIASKIEGLGGKFDAEYIEGFLPVFSYELDNVKIQVTVYGNYASWEPQPEPLVALLAWGKPDLVLISNSDDAILLAVEETAATPTGNQALQRCERQFGAAREGFPFWYLISEFGVHSDGGLRRDSIWPTLMGLELMSATQVPSLVLHYSDLLNPEDYESGTGMNSLFTVLTQVLINVSSERASLFGLESELVSQLNDMLEFVEGSWQSSLYLIPDLSGLDPGDLANLLCSTNQTRFHGTNNNHANLMNWPLASGLTSEQKIQQISRPLTKFDPLAELLEHDLGQGLSYGVIKGSGSKPQKRDSLLTWISAQNSKHRKWLDESGLRKSDFSLDIKDFPESTTGHHVITAKRILYLYDKTSDFQSALTQAFPRLLDKKMFDESELPAPALVYVSNSVKPGRIFGDPYTGQLSAYSVSFGALSGTRKVVVYFPHQSIAQAASFLAIPNNKGLRMFAELTDLLIFGGGLAIKTKTLEII